MTFKGETFDTAISDIKDMTNCFGLSSTPQTLNTFRVLTLLPLILFLLDIYNTFYIRSSYFNFYFSRIGYFDESLWGIFDTIDS